MAKPQTPGHDRKLEGVPVNANGVHDDGPAIRIVKNGEPHVVYLNQLDGIALTELRAVTGGGVGALLTRIEQSWSVGGGKSHLDPDVAAVIEWLGRRQAGEPTLPYVTVLAAAVWGDEIETGLVKEQEEVGDPND